MARCTEYELVSHNLERIVTNITSEVKKPILDINYWNFFKNIRDPSTGDEVPVPQTKKLLMTLLLILSFDPHLRFPEISDMANIYKVILTYPFIQIISTEEVIPPTFMTGTRNAILGNLCEIQVAGNTEEKQINEWIKKKIVLFENTAKRKFYERISSKEVEFWEMITSCFHIMSCEWNDTGSEMDIRSALKHIAFGPVVKLLKFFFNSENKTTSESSGNVRNAYSAHIYPDIWVKSDQQAQCVLEIKRPSIQKFLGGERRINNADLRLSIRQLLGYCIALSLNKGLLCDGKCLYITFFRKHMNLINSREPIVDIDKVSKLIDIDELYSQNPTFDDKITINLIITLLLYEHSSSDEDTENDSASSSQPIISSRDEKNLRERLSGSLPAKKRKRSGDSNVGSSNIQGRSVKGNIFTGYEISSSNNFGLRVSELPIFDIDKHQEFEIISKGNSNASNSNSEMVMIDMKEFIQQFGLPFNFHRHFTISEKVYIKIYDLNFTAGYVLQYPKRIFETGEYWDKPLDITDYYYDHTIDQQYIPELQANLKIQNHNMKFPKEKFNTANLLSYGILRQINGYVGYFISFTEIDDFKEKRPKTSEDILKGIQQLDILHSSIGITHGDIADRNICYDKNSGEFSIIDFDRSKIYDHVDDVDASEVEKDVASMRNLLKN